MPGKFYRRRIEKEERNRKRGPQKLSDVIAQVIIQRGYARQMEASAFTAAWEAATEPPLFRASKPGLLRKGVLEITVRNSTVMQELTFQKKQILKQLNEQITDQPIVDLRFRIGRVD